MKSLEIVVEKIEHEKEILNELKRCHVNNGFIEEEEKIIEKYQKIKADLERLEQLDNQITIIDKATEEGIISINSGRYLRNPLIGVDHNGELILYNTYHADTRTFYLEFKVSDYNKTWRIMNEEDCYSKNKNNKPIHRIDIEKYLEVLEIIRKKNVDIKLLKLYYNISLKVEDWLDTYNATIKFDKHKLTMEELLKLKQWLEVNDNGR